MHTSHFYFLMSSSGGEGKESFDKIIKASRELDWVTVVNVILEAQKEGGPINFIVQCFGLHTLSRTTIVSEGETQVKLNSKPYAVVCSGYSSTISLFAFNFPTAHSFFSQSLKVLSANIPDTITSFYLPVPLWLLTFTYECYKKSLNLSRE